MIERDPNIVKSGLFTDREEGRGSLWRRRSAGVMSIVWDDLFASDDEAFAEFERTVAEEGMRTFLDKSNVIFFCR